MSDEVGRTGRYLNIQTQAEANMFLQTANTTGSFNFFSSTLKAVAVIRKRERKEKLSAADKNELCLHYRGIGSLVQSSDQDVFRETVPEREIAIWLVHVAAVLKDKTNDAHWLGAGILLEHDATLFSSYCSLLGHHIPVEMTLERTKILEIISSMIISRKGDCDELPGKRFVDDLNMLMYGLVSCAVANFDDAWIPHKVFNRFAETGIMEQYFHCARVQPETELVCQAKKFVFRNLLLSGKFVQKRLKKGTPCGDALRATIAKRHGSTTICSHTLPFLQSLVKMSALLQIKDYVCCGHCKNGSLRDKLKRCGRCKRVPYCSQECQIADWSEHKMVCVAVPAEKRSPISSSAIQQILKEIYVDIMVRLVEECDKAGGAKMRDMILELDFWPDEHGRIPLFRDPPQFEIVPVARYFDGTRPTEILDLVPGVEDLQQPNAQMERIVAEFAHRRSSDSEPQLLSFESYPTAPLYSNGHQVFTQDRTRPMLSQEAVDAFRIAMVDNDFNRLSSIFENQELVKSYERQIRGLRTSG